MVVMEGLENVRWRSVQLSSAVVSYGCYCGFTVASEGGPVGGFGVSCVGAHQVLVSGLDDYSHELSCLCFDVVFEVLFSAGAFFQCGRCHIL